MASRDDQLWSEVSDLLRDRPGWSVQDSPTPGVDPNWVFDHHGKVDCGVFIDGRSLHYYEEKFDREVQFATVAELTTWLQANKPLTLQSARQGPRPPVMRWR